MLLDNHRGQHILLITANNAADRSRPKAPLSDQWGDGAAEQLWPTILLANHSQQCYWQIMTNKAVGQSQPLMPLVNHSH